MKVTRKGEGTITQGSTFTNKAFKDSMMPAQSEGGVSFAIVTFEDGALTHWHEHPGEQILYILAGEGRVGNEEGQFTVSVGDVIHTGPGEKHWHGAAPGQTMSHISITTVGSPIWYDPPE